MLYLHIRKSQCIKKLFSPMYVCVENISKVKSYLFISQQLFIIKINFEIWLNTLLLFKLNSTYARYQITNVSEMNWMSYRNLNTPPRTLAPLLVMSNTHRCQRVHCYVNTFFFNNDILTSMNEIILYSYISSSLLFGLRQRDSSHVLLRFRQW